MATTTSDKPWVTDLLDSYRGNISARSIHFPAIERSLSIVSVYNPAWPIHPDSYVDQSTKGVQLTQNQNLYIADLLVDALRAMKKHSSNDWIVAGDFNLSETFDTSGSKPRGNKEYLDRMAQLGFIECLKQSTGVLTPTFRNASRGKLVIHQLDHLFASGEMTQNLNSASTIPASIVFDKNLSDHLPIVAVFDV